MSIPRNWQSIVGLLLLTSPLWGQTTPEAAKERLGKVAKTASKWVFQRPWQAQATCAELQVTAEKALNLQMRQVTGGLPVAPPKVKIGHFNLTRQDKGVQVTVDLVGLSPQMTKATEAKANIWLAQSAQGGVIRALLLQPLGIPTFGNGSVLKDAECQVGEETNMSLTVTLTPHSVTKVMGRVAKDFLVRVDKEHDVVLTLQTNFTDGSLLQARYTHTAVEAADGTSFLLPTAIALKQKGLDALAQGVHLPTLSTIRYAKYRVGKGKTE